MGFGKYGEMWQDEGDMGNVCSKISDQFYQSIFSEDNFAFLAYYFEVTTKSICMHFYQLWVLGNVGNVGEGGKVWDSPDKQTI